MGYGIAEEPSRADAVERALHLAGCVAVSAAEDADVRLLCTAPALARLAPLLAAITGASVMRRQDDAQAASGATLDIRCARDRCRVCHLVRVALTVALMRIADAPAAFGDLPDATDEIVEEVADELDDVLLAHGALPSWRATARRLTAARA